MSILIGLIVASQNQNTLDFKNAWEKQDRFYQQLWWRAPSIAPGTALIAGEEILGYMGDYPLSFAINSFYGGRSSASVPIWFYALSENFDFDAKKVFDSDQLYSDRASIVFIGNPNNAIFIRYLPENHECLWVLRPEYAEYKLLDENMKIGALNSNISRIENTPSDPTTYDQIINENKQSWCYYFQKAELARQYKDWTGISWLWDEAITNGVSPDSGLEFLPFIEAYAHLGEWDKAYDLTVRSNTKISGMYLLLCPAWERLASETPSHITKEEFIEKAYNKLGCASSQ